MSDQMTSEATRNAISSRASVDGPTLFDWLGGETNVPSGQGVAHVSHGAKPAGLKARLPISICGQLGSNSSESAGLQSSWANRFQQRRVEAGGTLWPETWSRVTTPAQRSLPRLAVSAPSIRENDSGLFPTPLASETGWRKSKFPQGGTSLSTQLGGPPNPPWVAWLMGFPTEWDECAGMGTPSTPE